MEGLPLGDGAVRLAQGGERSTAHRVVVALGWILLSVVLVGGAVILLVGWQISRAVSGLVPGDTEPRPPVEPGPPLAVEVAPATDLRDDSTVLVSVSGAEPGTGVTITTCLADATAATRSARCHQAGGATYETSADGTLAVTVPVRRVVTTEAEGVVDCAGAPERCAVMVHTTSLVADRREDDRPRSGQRPIGFARDLGPVELVAEPEAPLSDLQPVSLSPEGPLVDGTEVTVTASGFVPGERLAIGLCSDDAWDDGSFYASCDALSRSVYDRRAPGPAAVADSAGAITYRTPVTVELVPPLGDDRPIDCSERVGRCAVVVAAEADLQRSAYAPLTMEDGG